MTSSTSPDPIPDPLLSALDRKLEEILAVLQKTESHMAAIRNAFVPVDMRAQRFDFDKERF